MNVATIIALIAGAVGGNISGGIIKNINLGLLGNSVIGLLGGYLGLQLAEMLVGSMTTVSLKDGANSSTVIIAMVSGGGAGALLTIVVGAIRNKMNRA